MTQRYVPGSGLSCIFEVSPPKTDVGMEGLCGSNGLLEQLYTLKPEAVCCTYSSGADAGKNRMILDKVARDGKTAAMTHIPCIGSSREGLRQQLRSYRDSGVTRVLALRGEQPQGRRTAAGELPDAAALTEFIRQEFGDGFSVAVAGSPEGRRSIEEDVEHLKRKQDCGADRIITRLCWDNDRFSRWLEGILAAGIFLPVTAGLMPVLDQAETIQVALASNGGVIPPALAQMVSQNWIYPNPFVKDPFDAEAEQKKEAFRKAGLDFTLGQIAHYRACGISGVYLHTRNRFADAAKIAAEAGLI